ncbi:phosphonopyruvate decarboxylase [Hungatella hathewayi]|uniref:phosphonopyruvate decarboxylase n=1 Tax=Hungatella hathewayi TaxID=154046 RepID=UPI00356A9723
MKSADFLDMLKNNFGIEFYAGVPDSLLSSFVGEIMERYGISASHIIAANEGNAAALAAGYHLSTGKIPCVYMQNSGQGNVVNPYASLLHQEVYGIPVVFVIGWRGEPGGMDEPQHIFQGKITNQLMDLLGISTVVVSGQDSADTLSSACAELKKQLADGKCVGFVIRKGALGSGLKKHYSNAFMLKREDAINELVTIAKNDLVVCTTGKASRELFEIREKNALTHRRDFLTVGSMGHSSSIALEIALQKKESTVWCIDGDGAMLMHMGAMAVIGAMQPENYIHVLLNNEAHETVGGMPTAAAKTDFLKIAQGCGYKRIYRAETLDELRCAASEARNVGELSFIEVKTALGSRTDLGRPTTTAKENKNNLMEYLREI